MIKEKLQTLGVRAKAKVKAFIVNDSLRLVLSCADLVERGLRRFYASVRRTLRPPVSVYRKKDTLTIVNSSRIGGSMYLVNVQSTAPSYAFGVQGATLTISCRHAGESGVVELHYPDAATASIAYREIMKVMQPAGWCTWALRLAALLLALLVFKATFGALAGDARQGGDPLAPEAPVGRLQGLAAAMADNPNFIPPDPAPQAMPGAQPVGGDLADRIYNESMAAGEQKMHEQMPPQPSASVEGLSGFGLEDGPDQSGPGCDPNLAFKVDGQ